MIQSKTSDFKLDDALDDVFSLLTEGYRKEAKHLLKRIVRKHPRHPEVIFAQGLAAMLGNNVQTAIKLLLKVIGLEPEHSMAHLNLAECYECVGDHVKQLEHYNYALKSASKIELKNESMVNAKKIIDKVMADFPEGFTMEEHIQDSETYRQGFELITEGNFAKAKVLFEQVVVRQPKHIPAKGNLGVCYLQLGNYSAARQTFEAALEIDPGYNVAITNLRLLKELETGRMTLEDIQGVTVLNQGEAIWE